MPRQENGKIYFNGILLSRYAITLDVAASGHILPDIDDETSKWFWHFAICMGYKYRKDRAVVVFKNSSSLLSQLEKSKLLVLAAIPNLFPEEDAMVVFKCWQESLTIMIDESRKGGVCSWYGKDYWQ